MEQNIMTLVVIPEQVWQKILETIAKLSAFVEGEQSNENHWQSDYVTERQAQKLLGKKNTTLWKL